MSLLGLFTPQINSIPDESFASKGQTKIKTKIIGKRKRSKYIPMDSYDNGCDHTLTEDMNEVNGQSMVCIAPSVAVGSKSKS